MSAHLTLTNLRPYGQRRGNRSMTTVRAYNGAMAEAIGLLQDRREMLGTRDKVPDGPDDILAVSLTAYRLERQGRFARCD